MKKIKVAICDDEYKVIDIIFSAVTAAFEKRGHIAEIETFTSAESLARRVNVQVFDLLFLDIDMPRMDGIALGRRLRKNNDDTDIIFVSNREDRVFDAIKINPFAFVRKSNFLSDISDAVERYLAALEARSGSMLTVEGKSGIVNVQIRHVIWFEGAGKVQMMHAEGKAEPIPVHRSMEKLEAELEKWGFIRIHKGMLVNFRFISRILVGAVELTTGDVLPMSRRKATSIKAKYLELLRNCGSVIL